MMLLASGGFYRTGINRYSPPVKKVLETDIGAFVRARRIAANLTQRELGELARVGTRFVSELERNKPSLRLSVVNKVLVVFGKTLGLVDAPKPETHEKP
jgi:y4mF family transcriptional regulator